MSSTMCGATIYLLSCRLAPQKENNVRSSGVDTLTVRPVLSPVSATAPISTPNVLSRWCTHWLSSSPMMPNREALRPNLAREHAVFAAPPPTSLEYEVRKPLRPDWAMPRIRQNMIDEQVAEARLEIPFGNHADRNGHSAFRLASHRYAMVPAAIRAIPVPTYFQPLAARSSFFFYSFNSGLC